MAKNILIYESHFELMDNLTDAQSGMLIKAIGLFHKKIEPTQTHITDSVVLGIWMAIRRDFVIQQKNYEKKCEINRKNGENGGRPKTHSATVGYEETQPNPQNLKDKDKDKDKDKEATVNNLEALSYKAKQIQIEFDNTFKNIQYG